MKLRVLHLTAATGLAGAERVLLNYLACHDAEHFEVTVGAFVNFKRQRNAFTDELERKNIPHRKILISSWNQGQALRETIKLLREEKIDLVHTHGYRSDVTGFLATRRLGLPIISTVHGWTPINVKLKLFEALARLCLQRFAKVICVSRELYAGLLQAGVKIERLVLLPNAVSTGSVSSENAVETLLASLGVASDERIVLTVGRLSPEKGLDILLSSFRDISADFGGKLRLIIVGDGPNRAELERLANHLGLASRVTFTGFRDDVAGFYAAAELFVLPSHTEGAPMALLEAMAAGLPVVCSRVGGIPDIVTDGVDGVLVTPGDPRILSGAMRDLLTNTDLASVLSARARETVASRFAPEPWAISIENIYREVCSSVVQSPCRERQ
jgi:glycosyltransferase involved in cell wall biosynthesis